MSRVHSSQSCIVITMCQCFFCKRIRYFPVRIFWFLIELVYSLYDNYTYSIINRLLKFQKKNSNMPPFGILANHKIKMCHNSMKKIMIQKITQNNWNFWTVNLIMRAKKLLTSLQIFRYAVPARTVTKKALHLASKRWSATNTQN